MGKDTFFQDSLVETVLCVLQQELWMNNRRLNSYVTLSNIHKYQRAENDKIHRSSA
jgi:hypothetical protein